MSQERIDSGTIILDQNGAEIGVIKKIYSENLARLELLNSDSIAIDTTLITDISTSGRILKKKSATITPEAKDFFKGATDILNDISFKSIELIIHHLAAKEVKRALQHFEFDLLTKTEINETLPMYEALGLVRGIELAGKTAQDFIVKTTFQASDLKPELHNKIAPEIVVDKLNQEKAFLRILWNITRIAVSQALKLKKPEVIMANIETIFEIGIKHIEIEAKTIAPSDDILYWRNRIDECILTYVALMIKTLNPSLHAEFVSSAKDKMFEDLCKIKINGNIKEQALKAIESFNLDNYEKLKTIEMIHSGIKGFNLKIMSEKKAMKELSQLINEFIASEKSKSIINLQKEINKFTQETRDVSKDFLNILFEIGQYLKKIEYGDSKINEFYSQLLERIHKRKYYDLVDILDNLNQVYLKEN